MGDSCSCILVNMNALIVIGLCALGANAQFISGAQPYYNNLLHSGAFSAGVYGINPLPYTIATVAPVPAPSPTLTKFHAQDELGQYNFGHYGGPSSRNEVRDAFGVVRGQVNYIDADGIVQQQNYIADAMGFRVSATGHAFAPIAQAAVTYAATSPAFAPAGATYYGASPYLAPRDATLLGIENNPGHAVSYRVY